MTWEEIVLETLKNCEKLGLIEPTVIRPKEVGGD